MWKKSLLPLLSMLLGAWMAAAGTVTAVIGNPELSALVGVILSEDETFEWLERGEIDRVLMEHTLGAEALIREFPHLECYVLLIAPEPGSAGEAVMYDARNGFRLGRWRWQAGEPDAIAEQIAGEMRRLTGAAAKQAIPVAVASLRDAALAPERRDAARQFAAYWEILLGNLPGIQLLERDRLELVTRERELAGTTYTLPGAAQLAQLDFSPGSRADAVNVTIRILDRNGRQLHEVGRKDILVAPEEAAEALMADLAAFWALPVPEPADFEPAAEAARHAEEARFLLTARDAGNALLRAQAAVALRPDVAEYRYLELLCRSRLERRRGGTLTAWAARIRDFTGRIQAVRRAFPEAPNMTEAAEAESPSFLHDFLQAYPSPSTDPAVLEECREAAREFLAQCRIACSLPSPYREWRAEEPCRSLRQWSEYDMMLMQTGAGLLPVPGDFELMMELWLRDEALSMAALRQAAELDPALTALTVLPDGARLRRMFSVDWETPAFRRAVPQLAELYRDHPVRAVRDEGQLYEMLAQLRRPEDMREQLTAYRETSGSPDWARELLRQCWRRSPDWARELETAWPVKPRGDYQALAMQWRNTPEPSLLIENAEALRDAASGELLDREVSNTLWPVFQALATRVWNGDTALTAALDMVNAPYRWRYLWRVPQEDARIIDAAPMPDGAGVWILYDEVTPDFSRRVYLAALAPDGTLTPLEPVPLAGGAPSYLRDGGLEPSHFGVFGKYALWAPGPELYLWDLDTGICSVIGDWPSRELRAAAVWEDKLYVWCGDWRAPKQLLRCALNGEEREVLISQLNAVKNHPWEQREALAPEAWYPDPERGRMLLTANDGIWSFDPATLKTELLFQCESFNCTEHQSRRIGDEIQLTDNMHNFLVFDCRDNRTRPVLVLADAQYDSGYPGDCRLVSRGNTLEGTAWFDGTRVWMRDGNFDVTREGRAQRLLLPRLSGGDRGIGRLYFPGPGPEWFYVIEGGAVFRVAPEPENLGGAPHEMDYQLPDAPPPP